MKQCPQCNRTYDGSQSFCLVDGTPLAAETEQETLVRQAPARKSRKFLWWLTSLGLIILVGGFLTVVFLIYNFNRPRDNAQAKRQTISNSIAAPSTTPKTTPTADAPKSPPVEENSPSTTESKPAATDEDSDDITPIGWETTATGFKSDGNRIYKFRCPPEGTEHIIWGSDTYTLDSSICTAAVHAGIITLAAGGVVTVEFRPGRLTYGSTVRNGIKSNTFGEYPRSYIVH